MLIKKAQIKKRSTLTTLAKIYKGKAINYVSRDTLLRTKKSSFSENNKSIA